MSELGVAGCGIRSLAVFVFFLICCSAVVPFCLSFFNSLMILLVYPRLALALPGRRTKGGRRGGELFWGQSIKKKHMRLWNAPVSLSLFYIIRISLAVL